MCLSYRVSRALAGGLLIAILVGTQSAPATAYARWEWPDATYLTGFLTVNGNEKKISWDPQASSSDPYDPNPAAGNPDTRGYGYELATQMRGVTGDRSGFPPDVEFTSIGLPRDVFLNASRLIQADLYIQGACENYQFDVELFAGPARLAGGVHGESTSFNQYTFQAPPAPAGYCPVRFRMPAETDFLAAGTVLTLKIRVAGVNTNLLGSQTPMFAFGLAGTHRSNIKLPTYSSEEAAFRLGAGAAPAPSPGGANLGWFLAGFGLGRRRATPVVLLLLAASLGGCVGGAGTDANETKTSSGLTGSATTTQFIDPGLAGNGTLLGVIFDELGLPLAAAHVSLLETKRFLDTTSTGQYVFRELSPGRYTLRVDHPSYHTYEASALVDAGKITKLDLTLEPLVKTFGGFARHPHDYWSGKPSKLVLAEQEIGSLRCSQGWSSSEGFTTSCTSSDEGILFKPLPVEDPNDFRTILPGTRSVEIVLTWDDPRLQRMGLRVYSPEDAAATDTTKQVGFLNRTLLYPRASGEKFHLAVNWDMTDPGHELFTSWRFQTFVPTDAAKVADLAPNYAVQLLAVEAGIPFGPIKASITVHRGGAMPYGRPHPDFWHGADTLKVWEIEQKVPVFVPGYWPVRPYNMTWPTTKDINKDYVSDFFMLVPPETVWVEVKLRQSQAAAASSLDWNLVYWTGPKTRACDVEQPGFFVAPSPDKSDLTWTWRLPLEPDQTDPYYAKQTRWCLFTPPKDDAVYSNTARNYPYAVEGTSLYRPLSLNLTLTAHQDPLPSA